LSFPAIDPLPSEKTTAKHVTFWKRACLALLFLQSGCVSLQTRQEEALLKQQGAALHQDLLALYQFQAQASRNSAVLPSVPATQMVVSRYIHIGMPWTDARSILKEAGLDIEAAEKIYRGKPPTEYAHSISATGHIAGPTFDDIGVDITLWPSSTPKGTIVDRIKAGFSRFTADDLMHP
jgi:hypothetical protein